VAPGPSPRSRRWLPATTWTTSGPPRLRRSCPAWLSEDGHLWWRLALGAPLAPASARGLARQPTGYPRLRRFPRRLCGRAPMGPRQRPLLPGYAPVAAIPPASGRRPAARPLSKKKSCLSVLDPHILPDISRDRADRLLDRLPGEKPARLSMPTSSPTATPIPPRRRSMIRLSLRTS